MYKFNVEYSRDEFVAFIYIFIHYHSFAYDFSSQMIFILWNKFFVLSTLYFHTQ